MFSIKYFGRNKNSVLMASGLMLLMAAGCDDEIDGGKGTAFELAVDFMGGKDAVNAMTTFKIEASGKRFITLEGAKYDDPAGEISTFTTTTSFDLASDNLRIDYKRTVPLIGNGMYTYSEIYKGNVGYVDGIESLFGSGDAAMLSSRWASGRKQQELLHPHLLVREALKDSSAVTFPGQMSEGGETFDIIEVKDAIHPIQLWVAADGHIARATTLVNDFLRRDTEMVVTYEDWQGEGVKFPNKVSIQYAGQDLHIEDRTKVETNATIAADQFTIPAEAMPMFDAALARFGEETPEFFQMFASIGIPIDARANGTPVATELEPGSGVYHLGGALHNSLAIEQANGIVIVEGPHSPERADAIIAWAKTMFPTKSITHVIATHHHMDHTAGLRSFVSAGAKVIVHEASKDFYADIFKAPSTVVPDTLAQTPATAMIESVVAGTDTVIADATNPVTIRQFTNPHCGDMVVVHVPLPGAQAGVLFESDLYNPGNGGVSLSPAFAKALLDGITDLATPPNALDITVVAGGHGGFAPLTELTAYVAANPVPTAN